MWTTSEEPLTIVFTMMASSPEEFSKRPVIIIHDSEVATAQAATRPRILEAETGEDISNCLSMRPNLGPRGATETFGPRRRGP